MHEACQIRKMADFRHSCRVKAEIHANSLRRELGIFANYRDSVFCEWPRCADLRLTLAAPMALDRITLTRFRNHDASRLDGSAGLNLLVGENGAGKTNVLEALSLLAPGPRPAPRGARRDGRGRHRRLRGQRRARLRRRARARSRLGTGTSDERPGRRLVQVNGAESERGRARRMARDRLADPGDGPPVRRQRRRAAALHGPAGAGARPGPRAPRRALRSGAARTQPAAGGRGRARPALARFARGAARRGRRRAGAGPRAAGRAAFRRARRACPTAPFARPALAYAPGGPLEAEPLARRTGAPAARATARRSAR